MPDAKTTQILRLQDGSIDYQYYAAKGSLAKNREMKIVVGKVLGASQVRMSMFPAYIAVILLVLIF